MTLKILKRFDTRETHERLKLMTRKVLKHKSCMSKRVDIRRSNSCLGIIFAVEGKNLFSIFQLEGYQRDSKLEDENSLHSIASGRKGLGKKSHVLSARDEWDSATNPNKSVSKFEFCKRHKRRWRKALPCPHPRIWWSTSNSFIHTVFTVPKIFIHFERLKMLSFKISIKKSTRNILSL